MRYLFALAFATFFSSALFAQTASVVYNYDKNNFNDSQPLPAEKDLRFTGGISPDVDRVKVQLFRSGDDNMSNPLASSTWNRPNGNMDGSFVVPINYKLRGGKEYDVLITYFRELSDAEREYLRVRLDQSIDSYLRSSMEVQRRSIELLKPERIIMHDLKELTKAVLDDYILPGDRKFTGFSDVVKSQLEQIEDANLNEGQNRFANSRKKSRAQFAELLQNNLIQQVQNEAEQYLNGKVLTTKDSRFVNDYEVEKTRRSITIDAGYGAAFLGELDFDDIDGFDDIEDKTDKHIDGSPYVGVSFPLANYAFVPWLNKFSISAGILINNLETSEGIELTGPVVKRPIYAALGYRAFKFVRLHGGVTITEPDDGSSKFSDVRFDPYVGASVSLNISVGLDDR